MTTNTTPATHPIFTRIEKHYNNTKPIRGRAGDLRPWGNRRRQNELVRKIDDNTYAARLYSTDVVTVHRDGRVVIDITFNTPTTNKFAELVTYNLQLWGFMAFRAHGRPWIYIDGIYHPANIRVTLKPHDTLPTHVVDMSDRYYVRRVVDRTARRHINGAVRKLRSVLAPLCALTDGKFTGATLAAIHANTPAALRYYHKPSLELATAALHATHDVDDPEQLLALALLVCTAGGTRYAMPGTPAMWQDKMNPYPEHFVVDVQLLSATAKRIFGNSSEYWEDAPITEPLRSTHDKVRVRTK